MARASLQAGMAFTNALLGATHAIAHQIGGALDLPHGLLNARAAVPRRCARSIAPSPTSCCSTSS